MPRLRRAEQVERNREVVIEAARRVFLARGYAGATLEAIADEASFSKGVVYSQFESKADLFLALLERRIAERATDNDRLVAKLAGRAAIVTLTRAFARDAAAEPGWQLLLIEFRVVAARDPALNKRYAAAHAKTLEHLVTLLHGVHTRAGRTPVMPLRTMAEVVMVLGTGRALERAANPNALPQPQAEAILAGAIGLTDEEEDP